MAFYEPKNINLFPGFYVITRQNTEGDRAEVIGVYDSHSTASTHMQLGDIIHGPFNLTRQNKHPYKENNITAMDPSMDLWGKIPELQQKDVPLIPKPDPNLDLLGKMHEKNLWRTDPFYMSSICSLK